jgi:hypothetical protein
MAPVASERSQIGLDVKRGVLQVVARAAQAGEDLRLIGRETTVIPHRGYEARRGWLVLVIRRGPSCVLEQHPQRLGGLSTVILERLPSEPGQARAFTAQPRP